MKHFRLLLPLLVLAFLLSACADTAPEPYDYSFNNKTITVDPEERTIVDGQDVYSYQVEENRTSTSYVIHYPNGATFHWTETETGGAGGWSENYDESRYIRGNILVDALEQSQPREKSGNVFGGILLLALGALNFFFPELPFYLRYGWAVKDAEPSDAYITWTKIAGVLVALVGLVWFIV